jgi:hypothetical protein
LGITINVAANEYGSMKQVEKLDMAIEQLEDALKAYFDERYHSAIVLAGAAEQLFAGYVMKHGQVHAWSRGRTAITKIANGLRNYGFGTSKATTEDKIGSLMNRAYNSSKHAGTKDHSLLMDPKFEAQEQIDRALSNFDMLSARADYDLPILPLAQSFMQERAEDAQFGQHTDEILPSHKE